MNRTLIALLVPSFALALACSENKPASAPAQAAPDKEAAKAAAQPAVAAATAEAVAVTDADRTAASEIWAQRCTPCHGPEGGGDGPASAGLVPKPRNLSDAAWHATVTNDHIEKIIVFGGAAVGKSPAMPPNPDLDAKKGVVSALCEKVRAFKK